MNISDESFVWLGFFWLCLCLLCGLKRRYTLFLALVFLGVSMTSIWLSGTLKVPPLAPIAITLHISELVCAVTAFLAGLFFARIGEKWKESSVYETDV